MLTTIGKRQNYPWAEPYSFMRLLASNPHLANADSGKAIRDLCDRWDTRTTVRNLVTGAIPTSAMPLPGSVEPDS